MKNSCIISDVHVHLDMRKEYPVQDFIEYLTRNKLRKVVLIINTRLQYEEVKKNEESIQKFLDRIEFVYALNKHDLFWKDGFEYCENNGKNLHLKIHPRLFEINEDEIDWYIEQVGLIPAKVVVVDDFLYGDEVAEDMGLRLVCMLAKKYPEKKIVMAHSGGVNLLRHVMQTKTYGNVYYDISLTCNYLKESSIERDIAWLVKFMAHRVMLGSDYPDFTISEAWEAISKQTDSVKLTDEKKMCLMYKNADSVYGGKL